MCKAPFIAINFTRLILGGLKGGKARVEKLMPEERKEIAQKAVKTRWLKEKPTT